MSKYYSLRKSRKILHEGFNALQRKQKRLSFSEKEHLKSELQQLESYIFQKDKFAASDQAKKVEEFLKKHLPKGFFDHVRDVVLALAFALVVAMAIRQFWFELYEVPTGSMRPTVAEMDRLLVSKTTFGIKIPYIKNLQFSSPRAMQRAGIIVFTVEGMDVADADTMYFHIFPGKKRYIKRAMGLPGDTVYFYGGRIYGVAADGAPIYELADENYLQSIGIEKIDHVPYIAFDGKTQLGNPLARSLYSSVIMKQMNQPVGRLDTDSRGTISGSFFDGREWVPDQPSDLKNERSEPVSYSDLWGIGNYAMARLLTREQVQTFYPRHPAVWQDAPLFLELHHTPNLTFPDPEIRRDELGRFHPMITPFTALIPLSYDHLDALQKNLYTARFIVKNGRAYRYHESGQRPQRPEFDAKFPNVPDGNYEFYYGKGYKVHFGGIRTELPSDHPLYESSPENIRKLFNLGINFNLAYDPITAYQPYLPQRFAYFRDGDLFVMGAPILKKDDPVLQEFIQQEWKRQQESSDDEPYIAFIDRGPPIKNGKLDVEFIRNFGLKIPEDGILALGDNYAMSADSRDFGFVPLENLRGAPSFIFWPLGSRLGHLPQPAYPWLTFSNLLIWIIAAIVAALALLYIYRRNQKSLF